MVSYASVNRFSTDKNVNKSARPLKLCVSFVIDIVSVVELKSYEVTQRLLVSTGEALSVLFSTDCSLDEDEVSASELCAPLIAALVIAPFCS